MCNYCKAVFVLAKNKFFEKSMYWDPPWGISILGDFRPIWGISFHAVVVFVLGKNLLFKPFI